ncbi:MBL fold metallo-hydrolase [Mesorhizobium sp. IMUNJ 23232]|uniref:MBL fold metallo-hydrolase n=1 Tax=Mesorhizobium sp. IMUNJ 23232 TaxID=3376064 RepID=UPI00379C3772
MHLQLLRNATLTLTYAGRTILIDPDFGPRHSRVSFTSRSRNPMVELPESIDTILQGVELVIVSHLHQDHFDTIARQSVPKTLPLICQPGDETTIRDLGFTSVTPLTDIINWHGILLTRREGSHGLGPVVDKMGSVMGLSLEAEGEPSVYWAGDTVLYAPVAETIAATRPDIIVTHSCGARWDGDLIVMDAAQTVTVCEAAPASIIVATHMEALDHATISRQELRRAADEEGIPASRLLIPADGETLSFLKR